MRVSVKIVAVAVLILSLGLHWAFLQAIAWTGMLVRYSMDGSLATAVTKTFDGEHPCALCKVIKQGRQEDDQQKRKELKPGSKLELGPIWQAPAFIFLSCHSQVGQDRISLPSRSLEPPKPRPRFIEATASPA